MWCTLTLSHPLSTGGAVSPSGSSTAGENGKPSEQSVDVGGGQLRALLANAARAPTADARALLFSRIRHLRLRCTVVDPAAQHTTTTPPPRDAISLDTILRACPNVSSAALEFDEYDNAYLTIQRRLRLLRSMQRLGLLRQLRHLEIAVAVSPELRGAMRENALRADGEQIALSYGHPLDADLSPPPHITDPKAPLSPLAFGISVGHNTVTRSRYWPDDFVNALVNDCFDSGTAATDKLLRLPAGKVHFDSLASLSLTSRLPNGDLPPATTTYIERRVASLGDLDRRSYRLHFCGARVLAEFSADSLALWISHIEPSDVSYLGSPYVARGFVNFAGGRERLSTLSFHITTPSLASYVHETLCTGDEGLEDLCELVDTELPNIRTLALPPAERAQVRKAQRKILHRRALGAWTSLQGRTLLQPSL